MKAALDPKVWWLRAQKDLLSAQLNFDEDSGGQAEAFATIANKLVKKCLKRVLA